MKSPPLSTEPKVLLVDDCDIHRPICAEVLAGAGYGVIEAVDGQAGLDAWKREQPALVVLDVDMPRLNGWQALARLRGDGCACPVLMLTGLGAVEHRVRGLAAGADDYVAKPCDPRELLARIHALLRRSRPAADPGPQLIFGPIAVDLAAQTATGPAGRLALTRTEYAILGLLARHAGRSVSRDALLDGVWGYTNCPNTRTVETHLWRLRKKLGDEGGATGWIQTAPGGYRLAMEVVSGSTARAA